MEGRHDRLGLGAWVGMMQCCSCAAQALVYAAAPVLLLTCSLL